jgi:hypothetical protein
MSRRVLTERELNRALLARQLLLERVELPVPRALERVGGLQTQEARSGYIGLWTRLAGFEHEQLTRALERRSVVQGTLMRVTIHMVSARDYPLLTAGVRESRRKGWLQARKRIAPRAVAGAAKRVRSALVERPRWRRDLVEELGLDNTVWNGAGMWVDLLRVPPSGTWDRPRGDLYAIAESWIEVPDVTEDEGLEHLVRRYLGGFGPATLKEAANWAGLAPRRLEPVVERMKIRRFEAEDGSELLDLPRAPLPDPETPAPPRFLPAWDATLLVHARRTQILPERYRAKIFNTRTPHSLTAFLVDGQVGGTWRADKGRVRIDPFERLPAETRKAVEEEADRLTDFLRGPG